MGANRPSLEREAGDVVGVDGTPDGMGIPEAFTGLVEEPEDPAQFLRAVEHMWILGASDELEHGTRPGGGGDLARRELLDDRRDQIGRYSSLGLTHEDGHDFAHASHRTGAVCASPSALTECRFTTNTCMKDTSTLQMKSRFPP